MAAGMGSRYGGLKQLDYMSEDADILMDFSIRDAIDVGFNKIVFVVRDSFKEEFIAMQSEKLKNEPVSLHYVCQEINTIPEGYPVDDTREKPWGTGHAVLVAKDVIDEPFIVINADDFYGKKAFESVFNTLQKLDVNSSKMCMVGYFLKNTVSENGYVSRDIAELIEKLDFQEGLYLIKSLDSETTSDILPEIEDELRAKIFNNLSSEEIAENIDALQTDTAADIISEFSDDLKTKVISQISNKEHIKDIVELLRYNENTAGGIMGKELVKVNENRTVWGCIREMRSQAADLPKVHIIYVVDNNGILKGRLSLKTLLNHNTHTLVKEIYSTKVTSVRFDESKEEVANTMQKYDLFVVPVVDEAGFLLGQITIDDVVDIIREEADKDYQMAAGLSEDVDPDDSIQSLTKARLPWLFLGLLGGIGAAYIMGFFEEILSRHKILFFFTPMIAAMAGNVGVQSSAIVVQGLANKQLTGSLWKRLLKELTLGLINGLILSLVLMGYGFFQHFDFKINFAIAVSLMSVIVIAALVGTFIPIVLEKRGIDPALATGPFITTSNDIVAITGLVSVSPYPSAIVLEHATKADKTFTGAKFKITKQPTPTGLSWTKQSKTFVSGGEITNDEIKAGLTGDGKMGYKIKSVTITNADGTGSSVDGNGENAKITGYKKAGTLTLTVVFEHPYKDDKSLSGAEFVLKASPTGITLSKNAIDENKASGSVVGTFTTTDATANDTFTYSFVNGKDGSDNNADFTIDGAVLKTAKVFDFEKQNSYKIRIRTTDKTGLTFEKKFTITINNAVDFSYAYKSVDAFYEHPDDGTVKNTLFIEIDSDNFIEAPTAIDGEIQSKKYNLNTHYTVANVPDGLTMEVRKRIIDTKFITVIFKGARLVYALAFGMLGIAAITAAIRYTIVTALMPS
uniref:Magnesium transporter MgtE n=1 Tax=Stylophora pistillata TaxID=50429 RepID=A0A2B4S1R6_STYPI